MVETEDGDGKASDESGTSAEWIRRGVAGDEDEIIPERISWIPFFFGGSETGENQINPRSVKELSNGHGYAEEYYGMTGRRRRGGGVWGGDSVSDLQSSFTVRGRTVRELGKIGRRELSKKVWSRLLVCKGNLAEQCPDDEEMV